ncbi:phosphoribosylanthranilate isomerase [Flavobacterium sp. N1994]|uniref:phosphoribosylanthranilate isomerase n=1 Tax=Flavobacterium sp. N1994 TaxID=2986827 RepID=UPI0022229379|nr:phosphoribosylanthranilate isomerase [Flavobacterium sp. N1994]
MKFPKNITEIAALQPDYLGFIFYEKSPRYFENTIPNIDKSIKKVGVFVNASYNEIEEKVKLYDLDLVQLHGDENPEFCALIENNLVKVIKAFSIDNNFNFNSLKKYTNHCSYYLFDTKGPKYGGNGFAFDWSVLENYPFEKAYFLSGGIGLENTNDIELFFKKKQAKYCLAIDLNSKFEIEPGLKNLEIVSEFIEQLKQKL